MKKNNKKTVKSAVIIAVLLLVAFVTVHCFLGCSGGDSGGDDGTVSPTETVEPVETVVIPAQVDLPSGTTINPSDIQIISGVNEAQPSVSGNCSIEQTKNYPNIVFALDKDDDPVLMSINVDPAKLVRDRDNLKIDAGTTAISLIIIQPYVCEESSEGIQAAYEIIRNMPQTEALANVLKQKIAANPKCIVNGDPEIQTALQEALDAYIAMKMRASRAVGQIDPSTVTSDGVQISQTGTQDGNEEFTIKNSKKRWLKAYSGNSQVISGDLEIPSSGKRSFNFNLSSNSPSEVNVVGWGIQGYPSGISEFDKDLVNKSACLTITFEGLFPAVSALLGAGVKEAPVMQKIAFKMATDASLLSKLAVLIVDGKYFDAFCTITAKFADSFIYDSGNLTIALQELGLKAGVKVAAKSIASFLKIYSALKLSYKWGTLVYDLNTMSFVNKFTITAGAAPTPVPTSPTPAPTSPTPAPTSPTPAPTSPTPVPTSPSPEPTTPTPEPTTPTPEPTTPTPEPTTPVPEKSVLLESQAHYTFYESVGYTPSPSECSCIVDYRSLDYPEISGTYVVPVESISKFAVNYSGSISLPKNAGSIEVKWTQSSPWCSGSKTKTEGMSYTYWTCGFSVDKP